MAGHGDERGFDEGMKAAVPPGKKALLLCRSGVRSIAAARRATELGIEAYNVLEGFEGDPDEHAQRGRRGGWRFAACPGGRAEPAAKSLNPNESNDHGCQSAAPRAGDLHPVAGVRIGVAEAGIRKADRKDLTVVLIDEGASVAGVFTQNRFCAAPVQVCREHLARGGIRAMVINTGNANAGTGEDGLVRARATCVALARRLDIAPEQVLPFSTGVIMEPLPVERIEAGLAGRAGRRAPDNWLRAAEGHHDHRHGAQGLQPAVAIERRDGDRHRHQQGRRDDPAEHGDHAGLPGHAMPGSSRRCCGSWPWSWPKARSTASPSTATRPPTIRSW